MPLTPDVVITLAQTLDQGLLHAKELDRLTSKFPDLDLVDAYKIQKAGIQLREKRGQKVIGLKMGLTSKAKREQMGLHQPIYGVLTDAMQVKGNRFNLKTSIHPKIEAEIAFWFGKDLRAPVTHDDILEACTGVCSALEILDSRYVGFKYFSLPDVVADNSSSAFFVLGEVNKNFKSLALENLEMILSVNGIVAQQASSSAISDHPLNSVVQLCDLLALEGRYLPAGSVVMSGAATAAIPLEPGMHVELKVQGLPTVEVRVDK